MLTREQAEQLRELIHDRIYSERVHCLNGDTTTQQEKRDDQKKLDGFIDSLTEQEE